MITVALLSNAKVSNTLKGSTLRNIKFISAAPRQLNTISNNYFFSFIVMCVILFAAETSCAPVHSRFQHSASPPNNSNFFFKYPTNEENRYHSKMIHRLPSGKAPSNELRRAINDFSEGVNPKLWGKPGMKRGIDVGIRLNVPPTKTYQDRYLEKVEDMLVKALQMRLGEENQNNTDCPSCEEEEEIPVKRVVKPAYRCDEWNSKHRICILERNIGDTVTFYLSTGKHAGDRRHPNVTWKQEFHIRNSVEKLEFVLHPDNPPENVIIGRRGYELRVSPITETDVEYNMYSATLQSHSSVMSKVYFMIRIVSIDLGFVYVGETIQLDLRKFVSLPARSMSFRWYMEKDGEHGTLPSNMKVSYSGRSIKISELRQEQEGILACSVYTNLDVLATKKRFLIKDLVKNNNVLQSSPNNTLVFKEDYYRRKRDPKSLAALSSIKLARRIRDSSLADDVEKAIWELTTTEEQSPAITTVLTATRSYDYNVEMENPPEYEEPPSPVADNLDNFPEISEGEDNIDDSPRGKQINIDIESGAEEAEDTGEVPYNLSPEVEALPRPPLHGKGMKGASRPHSEDRPITHKHPYQDEQPLESFTEGKHRQIAPVAGNNHRKGNIVDAQKTHNVHTEVQKPSLGEKEEVILNIDKLNRPRQIAEDRISRLISSCSSDFDCSETATCVKPSLTAKGFCRCLPGSNGVGIFCREETWMSDNSFDMEDLVNPDYMPYAGDRSV